MKKRLLSNAVFITLFIMIFFAMINRNQSVDIDVITESDTQVVFSVGNILEQTWQSNIKKVSKIVMPYSSEGDFEGEIEVEVLSDDGEKVLASLKQSRAFCKGENDSLTFSFKSFSVDLGKQYRIRLHYTNCSNEGKLLLPANSNYSGCCVDGNEVNKAIGLTVGGIKTSSISFLVLVCFPFFSIALFFMVVWKRKWEDTIGISFILITLVMVLAGMCGILAKSIHLIYILSIVSLLAAVWLYNRNKLEIKDLLSPGLFAFFFFFVFVIINCSSLYLSRADEFSFWGVAVKDMYYYDSLTKHADTVILHTYYPPFMLCIEYFFVYINGFFSDRIVYIGCQLMLISCLALSCKAAVKKAGVILPLIVAFFIAPLLFYEDIFSTLYTDAALAVFVAYVLICYFTEEESGFNYFRIIGGLAAITFTKPTGVVLAGLLTLVMLGDAFCKQWETKKYCIKKLLMQCFLTALVCLFYVIWQVYLKIPVEVSNSAVNAAENVGEETSVNTITSVSGMTFSNIINFITLKGDSYQYDVLKTYIKTFLVGDSFIIGNMSFSFLEILLLFFLFVWLFARSFEGGKKKRILRFGVLNCLAGVLYSAFLMATYIFTFTESEAVYLAHHERYLASWACGMFISLLVLVIHNNVDREIGQNIRGDVCIFLIMLLVVIAPTGKLVDRRADRTHMQQYAYGYEKTAEVARSFGKRAEQIYFVGGIDSRHMFAYALCPMKVAFSSEAPELSIWEKELKSYQYVFLLNTDERFREEYEKLFEEPDKILDASFYQVKADGNDILLRYIGTTKAMQNREE